MKEERDRSDHMIEWMRQEIFKQDFTVSLTSATESLKFFHKQSDNGFTIMPCASEDNSNNKVVSTCPCTVGTGDQKYDELKWESSIISVITKQHT